ncbi:hypothetical protein GUITHDRAFT_115424 [Guillardia theta CCMP2712]|uniref:Pentacotripeptide-repeat region of PRORP domain-containing protein n=1 Tax=Guillardia theta (strain CCMP2712) TaxID=905079 RepID=L1IQD2_GUITC|nr:hypothetical protein GUITHDRAFT_115424 [Guillardia theta CCMP2712]EKX38458.1 hypothetical protein GUITHDRAFT_115424 [Guillardia theta CCMP2712]|eukprot:XP_005825438.1 hypothetical protein GUITHDRAFT_115424 [Guillardia theta CCMP2712]
MLGAQDSWRRSLSMTSTDHGSEVSCKKKAAKKGSKNIPPELLKEMRKMEMMLKFRNEVDVDQVHRDVMRLVEQDERIAPGVKIKIYELLVALACYNHNAESAIRFLEVLKELSMPSESSYASVIRVCCEDPGTAKHAVKLLDDFVSNNPNRLRLRTVQPLLLTFLQNRDFDNFVDLWKSVLSGHPDLIKSAANSSIEPVEQLFVDIISAFSDVIVGKVGKERDLLMLSLDEILNEMSETLLSISEKSASLLSSQVSHDNCKVVNMSSEGKCPLRLYL